MAGGVGSAVAAAAAAMGIGVAGLGGGGSGDSGGRGAKRLGEAGEGLAECIEARGKGNSKKVSGGIKNLFPPHTRGGAHARTHRGADEVVAEVDPAEEGPPSPEPHTHGQLRRPLQAQAAARCISSS